MQMFHFDCGRKSMGGRIGKFFVAMGLLLVGWLLFSPTGERFMREKHEAAVSVARPVVVQDTAPAAADSSEFFAEYRLERERVRSERVDVLREVFKSAQSDGSIRQESQTAMVKMALNREHELEIENLIKARGFADALVFIRDKSVDVVVKSSSLSRDEVTQVAEIVSKITGVKPEEIVISSKP